MEKQKPIKTHWKKLHNPDYLGSWDFQPNEEKVLTIKEIKTEKIKDHQGKQEDCSVCFFKEDVKPIVLNVTNSKTITKVAGSPYIEDWQGVKIQLFTTEIKAFGDVMEAVRVRNMKPDKKKDELTPKNKKWHEAVKHIKDGNTTVDAILKHYDISEENQKILRTIKSETNA